MSKIHDWQPVVGMRVYIVPTDSRDKPYWSSISKVGRNYFYVGEFQHKFSITEKDDGTKESMPNNICYSSEDELHQFKQMQNMRRFVEHHTHLLSDEQIEMVHGWIIEAHQEIYNKYKLQR